MRNLIVAMESGIGNAPEASINCWHGRTPASSCPKESARWGHERATVCYPSGVRLSIFGKPLLAGVSTLMALGLLELGSRVLLSTPAIRPVHQDIANWEAQWQSDFFTLPPQPGVSSDGLRDYQHALAATDGRVRIVSLGDSVTFGYRVRYELSYPALLEKYMADEGMPAEVFNVALPGWSMRQELLAWRRIARKYKPEIVLLGVCLNDIAEMHNNLSRPPTWAAWLFKHSALVRAVARPEQREIASVRELFDAPDSARVRNGWARWHDELRLLAHEVSAAGGTLVVISFPFREQVRPDPQPPHPQEKLASICAQEGLPFIDMLEPLKPMGDKAFVDYDHLSGDGAAQTAKVVVTRLLSLGILSREN